MLLRVVAYYTPAWVYVSDNATTRKKGVNVPPGVAQLVDHLKIKFQGLPYVLGSNVSTVLSGTRSEVNGSKTSKMVAPIVSTLIGYEVCSVT